jgi:hypothetical protein
MTSAGTIAAEQKQRLRYVRMSTCQVMQGRAWCEARIDDIYRIHDLEVTCPVYLENDVVHTRGLQHKNIMSW